MNRQNILALFIGFVTFGIIVGMSPTEWIGAIGFGIATVVITEEGEYMAEFFATKLIPE